MEFTFSAEHEAWRSEIEGWIDGEFGSDWTGLDYDEADEYFNFAQGIRTKLAEKGWSAEILNASPKSDGSSLNFSAKRI